MAKKNKKGKKGKSKSGFDKKTLQYILLDIFEKHPKQALNYKQLAKKLGVKDTGTKMLINEVLDELSKQKKLAEVSPGKFKSAQKKSAVTGVLDMTRSGSAYLVSDALKEDVFIPRENMNKALHGDKVEVCVWARKRNQSPKGEVTKVIERSKNTFTGILQISKNYAFIEVTEKRMPYDLFIPPDLIKDAKSGQKVVAEIIEWNNSSKNPTAKIVDVLGKPGDNDTEMHAILTEFGLPYRFPEKLEKIAGQKDADITDEELARREDFRKITTLTIDPHDAKDFDDALSYRKLKNGNTEVGIHIADVTHYVTPGTEIDREAYKRGTSVYLVDRTVPMLPEQLSNFICSLRPDEDKLCYSAVFELDKNADIKKQRFVRSIINSDRRFTYEEAQERIETGKGDMAEIILHLDKLAKKMREKRFRNGAVAFERVETRFNIDEKGKPLGVYFKEQKDSNQLIEEFMLLANRRVAEFIGKPKSGDPKTFVYRIHDKPDLEKLYNFSSFIRKFGYQVKFAPDTNISKTLNGVLRKVKGKSEQNVVEQLAVRSMAKAVYTTENIGHYGLAFSHYTHFTSPIRRYPDMMVHRLLSRYLKNGKSAETSSYEKKSKHCSERERLAADAERASVRYKQVEFLGDKLGHKYNSVITGVTEHGIYAEIIENKIEGMIAMRDMDDDYYVYDEKNFCIVGKRSKNKYQLGDEIKIVIAAVDTRKRQIDFALAEIF